jgi:hypothetical protein
VFKTFVGMWLFVISLVAVILFANRPILDDAPNSKSKPATVSAAIAAPSPPPVRHQRPIAVSYDELARFPERCQGQAVVLSGRVIQVARDSDKHLLLRVAVTKNQHGWWEHDHAVRVKYRTPLAEDGRILEKDIVEFRGEFKGVVGYTAVLGTDVRKPGVAACDVRVISGTFSRPARDCT